MDNNKNLFQEILSCPFTQFHPLDETSARSAVHILKFLSILKPKIVTEMLSRLGQVCTKKDIDTMVALLCPLEKAKKATKLTHLVSFLSSHEDVLWQNVEAITMADSLKILCNHVRKIDKNFVKVSSYVANMRQVLNKAVHGHDSAKEQLERIVCQWINGKQDGYCFGFEGPPGVGKTSLAKHGLAKCLLGEDGVPRPFSMIQMGGDSNGSTLHGHNYTYVGSTWGDIVQILMDSKCMNPIIFIDEVDKISKTEHGNEIVGILTHLLDPTQNDSFQDKYFAGININLSKALFILSYNDPDAIDKILLDRIHRIKFKSLSVEEKVTICNDYLLPDILGKMGLNDAVHISPDVIRYIIEEYTAESGVRKLKEVLFDIVGAINARFLQGLLCHSTFPLSPTISDLQDKYLKGRTEMKIKTIVAAPRIGLINGLWANTLGRGGILPLTAKFYPSDKFLDLKLTGLQEKVMQESMHVALTVAWTETPEIQKSKILAQYNGSQKYGIHIHTGDGAVPKDGPSASTAITCLIYSILNETPIKNDYAITGEIGLAGDINEIGGLDAKFVGGIKAGVKHFLFPEENKKDYDLFMAKHHGSDLVKEVTFEMITNIADTFKKIFA